MACISDKRFIITLLLNIVCSDALIIMNKMLFTEYGFPNLTLTLIQSLVTIVGLVICDKAKVFQPKSVSALKLLPTVVIYCGFVVFTNLSLERNTIGTHMMVKTMSTLLIIVIQAHFYGRIFNKSIQMITVVVTGGVIFSILFDIRLDPFGLLLAAVGFFLSSLYQLWIGEYSTALQASPMQVMFYLMPMSTLLLLIITPFVEPVEQFFELVVAIPLLALILLTLTGISSFFVTISTYWIVQQASPVTYSVIGHLKSSTILIFGFILFAINSKLLQIHGVMTSFADAFPVFEEGLNVLSVLGITATLAGVTAYACIRKQERKIVAILPVNLKNY